MNETTYVTQPIRTIITVEGALGTISNIAAIAVVSKAKFGSRFSTFIFRVQPIFDLGACLSTTVYLAFHSIMLNNYLTGIYIIDSLICHFWFRNSLFWLFCVLSVQNLVCLSLDRVSAVIFTGSIKVYANRFFILYFIYMLSMLLILYVPVPLLRRYASRECVMDFSFPLIQSRVFIDYVVYSWSVFAYFIPLLIMLTSHAWIIRAIKRTHSPKHNVLTENVESNLRIKRKIIQLVITTAIMSCQQAILHSFECIVQIFIATGVVKYTYGTPIEQMSTFLMLLGCLSNPCILIFSTGALRRRLSTSISSLTEKVSGVGTFGQSKKSTTQ
ncbi:unnamed protein product [Schistosoma rodhaini]|nr:unnamed protein product [Schistosoma rodhaini]